MLKFVSDNDKLNLTTPTINIGSSVDLTDYYTKGETDAAINVAISEIVFPEPDLSEYAKKSEIPSLDGYALKSDIPTDYLTEIPKEYVTETELEAKGYLTEHQSLAEYAKKSDIPDVSGFALKSEIPSIEGLATETYVNEKIASIPEVDLSGYALKSEIPTVPTKTSDLTNDSGFITVADVPEVDLSNYALKTEIPDVSAYQTEEQVNALINSALGVIENGTY